MGCVNTTLNIVTAFDWTELTACLFWSIDTAAKSENCRQASSSVWREATRGGERTARTERGDAVTCSRAVLGIRCGHELYVILGHTSSKANLVTLPQPFPQSFLDYSGRGFQHCLGNHKRSVWFSPSTLQPQWALPSPFSLFLLISEMGRDSSGLGAPKCTGVL